MEIAVYPEVSYVVPEDTPTTYSFPFDYLRKAYVKVKINDTPVENFTVNNKSVVFSTKPNKGDKIYIYRNTSTTRLVSWADASVLKAANMTIQQVQELHILEEQQVWQERAYTGTIKELHDIEEDIEYIVPRTTEIYNNTVSVMNTTKAYKDTTKGYMDSTEEYKNLAKGYKDTAETASTNAQQNAADAGSKVEQIENYYLNATEPYSMSKQYHAGDLIFTDDGDLYRAVADNINKNPLENDVWVKVQTSITNTFEMDENGDMMPRVSPQNSTMWDLDEQGDITPTAYGSGTIVQTANGQIIDNQRNIARNDANIRQLSNDITGINSNIGTISGNVATVSNTLNGVAVEVNTLKQDTNTLSSNLSSLSSQVIVMSNNKQEKLIAGNNITIADDGKTISATGGSSDVTKSYVDNAVSVVSAENVKQSADISKLKTDLEFQKMLAKGITYSFQTDSTEAYSKSIPSGAKVMDIKSVQSGKSLVVNQLVGTPSTINSSYVSYDSDSGIYTISYPEGSAISSTVLKIVLNMTAGHIYYYPPSLHYYTENAVIKFYRPYVESYGYIPNANSSVQSAVTDGYRFTWEETMYDYFAINKTSSKTDAQELKFRFQLFDLTQMFGAGNEPTLDECKQIFVDDCYPYNEGTLTNVSVENVVVKNASGTVTNNIAFPTECGNGKSALNAYDRYLEAGVDDKDNQKYYWWSADNSYLGESVTEVEGASYSTLAMNEQNVGSVDLNGNEVWVKTGVSGDNYQGFAITNTSIGAVANTSLTLCVDFPYSATEQHINTSRIISGTYGVRFTVSTDIAPNKTTKEWVDWLRLHPQTVYYELAEPIRTPITNAIGSQTVEAGGSITFVGDNENYHLPIANTEEYVIALAEV